MSNLKSLLLCNLLVLLPAVALGQASPPPLAPTGRGSSDIGRLTRERDTNKKFFADALVTLNLVYNNSGDLKSSLVKTEGHSLFMTVEVNGKQLKGIAKSRKPKLQEAVEAGPLEVTGRWARPGTRLQTKCAGELAVGFQQIVFLPYGGVHGFSCHVEVRILPNEVYDEWKATFDADQTGAYGSCTSQHARGGAEFWTCIDNAGIPFPQPG